MAKKLDLVDQVYGRLTVIEEADSHITPGGSKKTRWLCKCECGNTKEINQGDLRNGKTQSCGCLQKELSVKRKTTHGYSAGTTRDPTYTTWARMKARCNNPNEKGYSNYGGKDITYDPRWETFEGFLEDMDERPKGNYSIDRVDSNLGYFKDNCRWVSDESGIQPINKGLSSRNNSGVKGVYWNPRNKTWTATLNVNKKRVLNKSFKNIEDAIAAREAAEEKYHAPLLKKAS